MVSIDEKLKSQLLFEFAKRHDISHVHIITRKLRNAAADLKKLKVNILVWGTNKPDCYVFMDID